MREPSIERAVASLVTVADEEAWEADALCRAEDPLLFFGPNRFEPKRERLAREDRAKAICAGCPALEACRQHAIVQGELYGVWGGLGEADRRPLIARYHGAMPRSA